MIPHANAIPEPYYISIISGLVVVCLGMIGVIYNSLSKRIEKCEEKSDAILVIATETKVLVSDIKEKCIKC